MLEIVTECLFVLAAIKHFSLISGPQDGPRRGYVYAHEGSNSTNVYMRGTKFKEYLPHQTQSSTANVLTAKISCKLDSIQITCT